MLRVGERIDQMGVRPFATKRRGRALGASPSFLDVQHRGIYLGEMGLVHGRPSLDEHPTEPGGQHLGSLQTAPLGPVAADLFGGYRRIRRHPPAAAWDA